MRKRAAAASETARLRHIEKTFGKVVESITAELALGPLLDRIMGQTCELLDVPVGSIGLYDPNIDAIRIAAARGTRKSRIGMIVKRGRGVGGRVLETGKPVIEHDYGHSKDAWEEIRGCDVMGVPILRKGKLLGYFGVGAYAPRRFDRRDLELLQMVARQASVAIENAQRFESQRRRMERLSLITKVSHIISAGLELDDLLRRTVLAIHRVLGYTNVSLALVDSEDPQTLVVRATGGTDRSLTPAYRLPLSEGVSGAAVRERRPQLVPDVRNDPRYVPCRGRRRRLTAALAVPILMGREALGVINVEGDPPFGDEDRETLQLVAEHLAAAIHNAFLFEKQRVRARRLALISRIGQIAATGLDRRELLQRSADAVHELLGYANIDIPVIDPDQPDVLIFGARGGDHKKMDFIDRMSVSKGIIGSAAREGRTQLVNDVTRDPRYVVPPLDFHNRAELAVPIIQGGRVLGVLNVEGARAFDADDAASLEVVADHLAVALKNAELHQASRREAVQTERQRLSRDLHDSVNQLLFSVSLLAQSLGASWRRSSDEGERKAERIVQLSGAALREMRGLIGALYPSEPDEEATHREALASLPSRLRDLLPEAIDGGPKVALRVSSWTGQAREVEEMLFRIGQEAVTNALKHANASRVDVHLSAEKTRLVLTVSDDGRGFRPAKRPPRPTGRGGLGLGIMAGRAREQGGTLTLRSSPGRGTTVQVSLRPRRPGM